MIKETELLSSSDLKDINNVNNISPKSSLGNDKNEL